jgi:beta-lactamase superfamily II metal-dependent hydrolase
MRIEIFNVDHGQCAVVTSPNGARLMIDCGTLTNGEAYWWPSVHFYGQRFLALGITNLDEDHVTDFPMVMQHATPSWIFSNPTVGYGELLALKKDGMGSGLQGFARWLGGPKRPAASSPPLDFGPVDGRWYCNRYSPGVIDSTNDLSMVFVVQYGAFKILFGGDLEKRGWAGLLAMPAFVRDLVGVNVFVASHHGRENGCHTDLFDRWQPNIFIISDEELQFDSQETTSWYRNRARGIPLIGRQDRRYVYTTRSDGSLQIDVQADGRWLISPVTVQTWPKQKTA